MYVIRSSRASDFEELQRIHKKREFDFPLPKRVEECAVIEDTETGEVAGIVATKVTREAIMWLDPDWRTPRLRWEAFKDAHDQLKAEVHAKGIDEVHMSVLSDVPEGFVRRLIRRLGWCKEPRFMSLRTGR